MDKVDQIFCRVFRLDPAALNDQCSMDTLSNWDSLTHMDLVASLEEQLLIQLTLDEIMEMKTLGSIRLIVQAKLS